MINQTLFSDMGRRAMGYLTIPQGGRILETVSWLATVPTGVTYPFKVYSIFGNDTNGTVDGFQQIFYTHVEEAPLTGPLVGVMQNTDLVYYFPADAPIATYDCLTMVGYTEADLIYYFDFIIDSDIVTIEPGLTATIVATSFSALG